MARILGNLKPEDDYTHELGPEENFNESVYFNFFDPSQNRGGFVRIGNRANEGYAEMTVIVWNPDGSAYFMYGKPEISSNDGWNAGGLKVDVEKPTEVVHTTYSGKVLVLEDPRAMHDPSKAFKESPREELTLKLRHEAVGPFYGHVGDPDDDNQFARAHTEQHMRVTGELKLGNEAAVPFNGHGMRDHSWGPRYWQATPSYRWITGNFGDDLGMMISTNGAGIGRGLFQEGDEIVTITEASIDTDYEPGTRYHTALRANLTLEDGRERRLEGKVMGFIPLRNRRGGANTHIGEGMTQYTLDGERTGYGLSEYLDQPED